jgi:glutaredoxin
MLRQVSHPRGPQSGHITCYLDRTYHVLPAWPHFILEDGGYAVKLPRMTQSREVVVYSRKGCHLCEIVKESLVKLHKRGGFTWREIDVDSNAEVRRLYNDEVPVVFINGRKAFKYRMDEQEFLRKLSA